MRKEGEIQRAAKAFKEAVEFADKLDQGVRSDNHKGNGNSAEHRYATLERGPKPPIPLHTSITNYSQTELNQLLGWIASDGQLRTDEQIIDEMVAALGFSRRGTRIQSVIQAAITRWRPQAAQTIG